MGAVNYLTSDYITMGVVPYSVNELMQDCELMRELQEEANEYGGTAEDALNSYISDCYEDDRANIERELEKHYFRYFHVTIAPGYYEGFTLKIEYNYPAALDGWEDRQEAYREITEIKRFLIACARLGLVKCTPGWVTRYADYNGTVAAIGEAIKEMREEVKNTPTWRQYNRI